MATIGCGYSGVILRLMRRCFALTGRGDFQGNIFTRASSPGCHMTGLQPEATMAKMSRACGPHLVCRFRGLKAPDVIAWGEAPGKVHQNKSVRPEGAGYTKIVDTIWGREGVKIFRPYRAPIVFRVLPGPALAVRA